VSGYGAPERVLKGDEYVGSNRFAARKGEEEKWSKDGKGIRK